MNHCNTSDFDVHAILHFSVFVKQGVVNFWLLHIIPKGTEFSSNSIHFGMGRYIVFELAFEIITSNGFNIKTIF